MNSILKKLQKTRTQLVEKAENRDKYYNNRTEQWQNSQKGVGYEVNTMLIADVVEDLDKAIANTELILK